MTIGLAGLTVVNLLPGGLDPLTDGAEAADAAALVAEDDAADALADSCETAGGQSFTAGTKVLLASGAAVPIARLKPGDKVLATNTKTGKTSAEPVTAVLIHHDNNRYDLRVKTASGSTVIDTTSSHLFWDQDARQWVKAGALKPGTHPRTAHRSPVTGHRPRRIRPGRRQWLDVGPFRPWRQRPRLLHPCRHVERPGTQLRPV